MRAVVYDRYGPPDVLHIEDVERPAPKDDEVLIKVYATTVTRTDCAIRSGADPVNRIGYSIVTTGNPFTALRRPKQRILGSEVAGEVAAVGSAVREFAVGDAVFGVNPGSFGAHAEFIRMREGAPLAHKPAGMSFEEAAAICDGAILALNCLRAAHLQQGQRVLVYGASGAMGTAGVQLAKALDAHVTAVCNTKNVEIVRSLGADEVIDYTRDDFTKNGQTYDVIFDAVGKQSFRHCAGSLKPGGIYLPTDGWENLFLTVWTARRGGKRVIINLPPRYTKQDVLYLKGLIEAGKYRAVIDWRYRFDQVVDATRYVETGQKTGNVVLKVVDTVPETVSVTGRGAVSDDYAI